MKSHISRIAFAPIGIGLACALAFASCDAAGDETTTAAAAAATAGSTSGATSTPIAIENKVLQYGKTVCTGNVVATFNNGPTTITDDSDRDGFVETLTVGNYLYLSGGAMDVYSVNKYTDGGSDTSTLKNISKKTASYSYTLDGNKITVNASSLYPYTQDYTLSLSGEAVIMSGTDYIDYWDNDGDGNKTETCTIVSEYPIMSSMTLADIAF